MSELSKFFDRAVDLLAVADFQGRWVKASPSWSEVLGWSVQEILDSVFPELVHPDDVAGTVEANRQVRHEGLTVIRFDNRYRCKGGSYQWLRWTGTADADAGFIYAIARPMSDEEKQREATALTSRVGDAIVESTGTAVVTAKLDGTIVSFNVGAEEMFGYAASQVIDQSVSMLMPKSQRHAHDDAMRQYRGQHDKRPIRTAPLQLTGRRSDGVTFPLLLSLSDADGDPPLVIATMLASAHVMPAREPAATTTSLADRDESIQHPGFVQVAQLGSRLTDRDRSSIRDLRSALAHDEFVTHYQPIVDADGAFTGMEALLRWQPPGQPIRPAYQFILEAERSGLIAELGMVTIQAAIRDTAALIDAGLWPERAICTINLSPSQLARPDIVSDITAALEHHQLPAPAIGLEITESVVLDNDPEALRRLGQLRDLGCPVLIDDFGTGYASMSYLHRLSVDGIKLDRTFVQGARDNPIDSAIIASQISLASLLDLTVVAEGIEDAREFETLQRRGCRRFQGYLFARPSPIDTIRDQLRTPAATR